ncbi:MAG: PLDc N-terminal domain-containing protein [bacterium]|nr:PLDc N-terminal domain-containing protein [bacterium]
MYVFSYSLGGLITLILMVWAIMDLLGSRRSGSTTIIWILVILVLPLLGAILYLLIGRNRSD